LLLAVLAVGVLVVWSGDSDTTTAAAAGVVSITGEVVDPQGEPIRGAEVHLSTSGTDQEVVGNLIPETQPNGTYVINLEPRIADALQSLSLQLARPHFETVDYELTESQIQELHNHESIRVPTLTMKRRITAGFWVASLTFAGVLILIAFERLHNTMAALLGVAIIFVTSFVGGAITPDLFIFGFQRALEFVDFDVIFLVMGMMIVISVIEETGIFQWLAYQSYRLSRGRAWLLVAILMIITAIASALLDNVTTMLLMTPMTIQIALALGMNPLTLLIPEILASNIGGISTLIGTPTNIMIGSFANIGFNDFVANLTPGVLLAQVLLTGYVLLRYRKQFFAQGEGPSDSLLEMLRDSGQITEPDTLKRAGFVFVVMVIFFVIGERFHLVPAVTALVGAVVMLLWVSPGVEEMLKVVDWTTLMFFIALFMVVGAIQEVGLISMIAVGISNVVGESLTTTILVLVWSAALLSGVIANIPFTAAMLPVVGFLSRTVPGATSNVLFYGLSIGSAMGGNSSLIGASANLVTAGIAERAGYKITYIEFLKVGLPATVITVAMGTLWLFIRF
jgi:Na+/H+ antiporter NhaD/arsenite permease-like protein